MPNGFVSLRDVDFAVLSYFPLKISVKSKKRVYIYTSVDVPMSPLSSENISADQKKDLHVQVSLNVLFARNTLSDF